MISVLVLIGAMYGAGGTGVTAATTQEFYTMDACMVAAKKINDSFIDATTRYTMRAFCVPK